jgi:DNA-binding HxlR family transcriptional regulator
MDLNHKNCADNDTQCAMLLRSVGDALYAVGGKWKLRVIIALFNGDKRFNQLQRSLTGISAKVLSNELKDLETNGFVKRKVDAMAMPVVVTYEPTEYCNTLKDVVNSLSQWGIMHREKIMNL